MEYRLGFSCYIPQWLGIGHNPLEGILGQRPLSLVRDFSTNMCSMLYQ